jgi:hypothetical protein
VTTQMEGTPIDFVRGDATGPEHEPTIKRFLQSDQKLIALCHWHANIDNAWFRRDDSGVLQCGLLDWGHANQMNVAFALWGCLCTAGLDIWDHHPQMLLVLFGRERTSQPLARQRRAPRCARRTQ